MYIIIGLLGLAQMAAGYYADSAVLFGSGTICLALASVIAKLTPEE